MRVPLGGRKTRGYVVEVALDRSGALRDLGAVSGAAPVFDAGLLKSLDWAATHYVAPVAILLDRAAPPNLPKSIGSVAGTPVDVRQVEHPLTSVALAASAGKRRPVTAIATGGDSTDWLGVAGAGSQRREVCTRHRGDRDRGG